MYSFSTKKGEFEAHLPFAKVGPGTHVVAARIASPVDFNATIQLVRIFVAQMLTALTVLSG